jgi:hypothetical protein
MIGPPPTEGGSPVSGKIKANIMRLGSPLQLICHAFIDTCVKRMSTGSLPERKKKAHPGQGWASNRKEF